MIAEGRQGWVYLLRTGWHYKIGRAKSVPDRVASLQTASPYQIEFICAVFVDDMHHEEARYHKMFSECRSSGEWFELTSEQVEDIKDMMLIMTEDDIIGDTQEDSNHVLYMEGDYIIKRIPKEGEWYPSKEIANGWYITMMTVSCPCTGADHEREPTHGCWICSGHGRLYTEDYSVLCGDTPLSTSNTRPLTNEEICLIELWYQYDEDEAAQDEECLPA